MIYYLNLQKEHKELKDSNKLYCYVKVSDQF
jgi:hypothetical protein